MVHILSIVFVIIYADQYALIVHMKLYDFIYLVFTSFYLCLSTQSTESMRDFLVEKLRSAEQALKSTFGDLAAAKNQYSVDQEVINYLDLRGQELDAHNGQLRKELERLNAMHELQRGRHSHSVWFTCMYVCSSGVT